MWGEGTFNAMGWNLTPAQGESTHAPEGKGSGVYVGLGSSGAGSYRPGVPQGQRLVRRARQQRVGVRQELDAVHRVSVTAEGVTAAFTVTNTKKHMSSHASA